MVKGFHPLNRHIIVSALDFSVGAQHLMSTYPTQQIRRRGPARRAGQDRWAVILAGGDGTRLRSFTRTIAGDERPKQFCAILGRETLLDQTRRRVALSVEQDKTLLVLTESHKPFYQPLMESLSRNLLLVQPENKGTAPAILYPLLRIAEESPEAIVAIFPSDHHFSDDEKFMSYVEAGFETARRSPETVTLLGITPEAPEVEFGWIEPHSSILGGLPRAVSRVRRFWEKPTLGVARKLMKGGCLWNSFVMVGKVDAFLKMTRRALPDLHNSFGNIAHAFGTSRERELLSALYSRITDINFSHEVLAMRPDDLGVMKVDSVGWSDLGEPSRVLAALSRLGTQTQLAQSAS
jgi:mannose-1-phosphate guanylyltransferase